MDKNRAISSEAIRNCPFATEGKIEKTEIKDFHVSQWKNREVVFK